MKSLITVAIALVSTTAMAGPLFDLEQVNFLNSVSRFGETIITRYSSTETYNQQFIRSLETSYAYGLNNAGTSLADTGLNDLALDFDGLGMMWMDSEKNLWGLDFNTRNMEMLVSGSIIRSLENDDYNNTIAGIYSYGSYTDYPNIDGEYTRDLGSVVGREGSSIDGFVFKDTDIDPYIRCENLGSCAGNIVGMQYYDNTSNDQDDGNLYYLVESEDGSLLNSSIFYHNVATLETGMWSSLADLGITDENAPRFGMAFFNTEELEIGGSTVDVPEPGTAALMATGAAAIAVHRVGMKKGLLALCKKRGFCAIYDTVKKAIVGTAKVKK